MTRQFNHHTPQGRGVSFPPEESDEYRGGAMGRLAAWQKFGIVLSIAWAIGTAVHTHNRAVEAAQSSASFAYKVCADGKDEAHSPDLSECDKEKSDSVAESMQGDTANAAIVALA